jgi:NAD(P)-dependent dehydrogenase (short-subunit alcohol dehydrogenase family)
MDLRLRGTKALVTGGTRGIGRAIAECLADEGAHVSICARRESKVRDAITEMCNRGYRAFGLAADVANPDQLRQWVDASAEELGGIDIVVANASALATGGDAPAFRRAFEVDLLHTVNLVEFALPRLTNSPAGAIIAIASISGVEDYGFQDAAYGAMKAALLFYIKSLARELAPRQIRANVVSPGTTFFEDGFWGQAKAERPAEFQAAMDSNPMGRMASPEDIARAVAFVASPAAAFITGINFVVDGSFTRRAQN